jgi:hypothetical protein
MLSAAIPLKAVNMEKAKAASVLIRIINPMEMFFDECHKQIIVRCPIPPPADTNELRQASTSTQ